MQRLFSRVIAICLISISYSLLAADDYSLDSTYPDDPTTLSAEEIIRQVWFVNHYRSVNNFSIQRKQDEITWMAYRNRFGKYRFRTLERFLKNHRDGGEIHSSDLVIFHYPGAVDGTGILIEDYADTERSQSVTIWLPALRKPRRFAQPAHEDAYAGTDWTYGDVALRRPWHETHELLRTENFTKADGGSRLNTVSIAPTIKLPFIQWMPTEQDLTIDRPCFVVKSTTRFRNFWYDYRISWIDTESFADYRTIYYRRDRPVKIIDRLWHAMKDHPESQDIDDPRAQYWSMWYGKTYLTGHETMAVIPPHVTTWNSDLENKLWSVSTLEKLKR